MKDGDAALTLDNYQDRSRTGDSYPRCRIILDDDEPIEAPWLLPLLSMFARCGELAGTFARLVQDDRGVLTRERARSIGLTHGDVMCASARVADAQSRSLSELAWMNLERQAERKRRGR